MARILIVEDEVLIAMLLEDIVTDLGHHPVGPAMRLQPALAAAEHEDFDFAILDINLAGQQSFPVADCLLRRGIPFIFASGYGQAGLNEDYARIPALQKPYDPGQIARMIEGSARSA
ncbi:response regulator [Paracoccus sp. 22332]|uniref:response regulator n=1 Tax=Paracoccus sp. 22332 TaxID=3453913 RepID=UPI003F877859